MSTSKTVYLVSRHQGTIDWVTNNGYVIDCVVGHLCVDIIQVGDMVIGTLPIHLAAEVCLKGGLYKHLSLDIPPEWRGRDMTAKEVSCCNPRLQRFNIQLVKE